MTIPESEPPFAIGVSLCVVSSSNEVVSTEAAQKTASSLGHRRPPYIDMVVEAVKNLKSRRGTSVQAIKKYLKDTYQVSTEKSHSTYFICRAINTAVEKNTLVRVSGKGASGSFKLGESVKKLKANMSTAQKTGISAENPTKVTNEEALPVKVTTSKNKEKTEKVKKSKKNPTIVAPESNTGSSKNSSVKKAKAESNTTNPQVQAKRPKLEELVVEAVKNLKTRKGSSLQAIKKYLKDTHQVDEVKSSRFITKAINAAVQKGALVRISGQGASGSFKVGQIAEESKAEAISAKTKSNTREKAPNEAAKNAEKKNPVKRKKTEVKPSLVKKTEAEVQPIETAEQPAEEKLEQPTEEKSELKM